MAYGDYAHCSVCDCKAFYDASVDYDVPRFGVMEVLCKECSKTHEIVVRKKDDALEGKS
jgi:hypothetical protein